MHEPTASGDRITWPTFDVVAEDGLMHRPLKDQGSISGELVRKPVIVTGLKVACGQMIKVFAGFTILCTTMHSQMLEGLHDISTQIGTLELHRVKHRKPRLLDKV